MVLISSFVALATSATGFVSTRVTSIATSTGAVTIVATSSTRPRIDLNITCLRLCF
uniref:Uncharacterized protein n=1 Tax=uncultured marine virus TaxID=186617 RepID=A0A0F7L815_9VIRU|nr:hypothetical protein [uncultured marine virus]